MLWLRSGRRLKIVLVLFHLALCLSLRLVLFVMGFLVGFKRAVHYSKASHGHESSVTSSSTDSTLSIESTHLACKSMFATSDRVLIIKSAFMS